jgi:hypothetical protein
MRSEIRTITESQSDLFGAEAPPAYRPNPDKVRARLHKIPAEARAVQTSPWEPARVSLYRTIFPQMKLWPPTTRAPIALRLSTSSASSCESLVPALGHIESIPARAGDRKFIDRHHCREGQSSLERRHASMIEVMLSRRSGRLKHSESSNRASCRGMVPARGIPAATTFSTKGHLRGSPSSDP